MFGVHSDYISRSSPSSSLVLTRVFWLSELTELFSVRLLACPISSPSKHRLYVILDVRLNTVCPLHCSSSTFSSRKHIFFKWLSCLKMATWPVLSAINMFFIIVSTSPPITTYLISHHSRSLALFHNLYLDIIIVVLLKQNWYEKEIA